MSERLKKVDSLIHKIVSDIIQKDIQVPKGKNYFYTVTDVEVTPDLDVARVYISVLGSREKAEEGFTYLCHALHRIQKLFSGRIRLKYTPKLQLFLDHTSEYAFKIDHLIREIHKDEK